MRRFGNSLIILVIVIIGVWLVARHPSVTPNTSSSPSPAVSVTPSAFATVNYQGVTGKTALELLKASHQVQTKHYDFGNMVQSIDGQASDSTKFWIYYVDGKQATTGADSYQTTNGQTIEWRLEPAQ